MSDLSDEVLFNNCKISIFQCDFADSLNSFVVSSICQYIEMGKYMKQRKIFLFQCLLSQIHVLDTTFCICSQFEVFVY